MQLSCNKSLKSAFLMQKLKWNFKYISVNCKEESQSQSKDHLSLWYSWSSVKFQTILKNRYTQKNLSIHSTKQNQTYHYRCTFFLSYGFDQWSFQVHPHLCLQTFSWAKEMKLLVKEATSAVIKFYHFPTKK